MSHEKITTSQLLLPLFLLTLVVTIFLGFQSTLLVSDRSALQIARTQQEKPLEQLAKVKAQVNALAVGTLKLSKEGNKDAQNIVAQLKKAGIDINDQAPPPVPATGTP